LFSYFDKAIAAQDAAANGQGFEAALRAQQKALAVKLKDPSLTEEGLEAYLATTEMNEAAKDHKRKLLDAYNFVKDIARIAGNDAQVNIDTIVPEIFRDPDQDDLLTISDFLVASGFGFPEMLRQEIMANPDSNIPTDVLRVVVKSLMERLGPEPDKQYFDRSPPIR